MTTTTSNVQVKNKTGEYEKVPSDKIAETVENDTHPFDNHVSATFNNTAADIDDYAVDPTSNIIKNENEDGYALSSSEGCEDYVKIGEDGSLEYFNLLGIVEGVKSGNDFAILLYEVYVHGVEVATKGIFDNVPAVFRPTVIETWNAAEKQKYKVPRAK